MAREKGNFKFAANLEVKKGAPLDPRVVVNTKAELLSKDTWPVDGDIVYLYNGLLVAVLEDDNNIYQLIDADNYSASDYSAWKKVGGSTGGLSIGTNTDYNVNTLLLSTQGLEYNEDTKKLAVSIGSNLLFDENGKLEINIGSGLKNNSYGALALDISPVFTVVSGGLDINVSTGIKKSDNKDSLVLDVGSEFTVKSSVPLSLNIGEGLYKDFDGICIATKIREVTTDSFKTINGNSILGSGDIEINTTLGASDFINGGIINITTTGDIEEIYNSLDTGAIALCIIGDSNGSYPSSETRVNVNSAYTVSANYFFSEDARGANVGDMLMITKQTYLLINRCALKIIPINDSKVATDEYTGTDGIMTVWDKTRINKVDGIEWTANDTRAWLNSVVNTDLRKTKYGYGTALEDCIKTGALAYTGAEIAGINANWTIFVDCTTDTDGGGYYHLIQTAICRDEAYLGRIWKRFGYYTSNTAPEFLEWKEITAESIPNSYKVINITLDETYSITEVDFINSEILNSDIYATVCLWNNDSTSSEFVTRKYFNYSANELISIDIKFEWAGYVYKITLSEDSYIFTRYKLTEA